MTGSTTRSDFRCLILALTLLAIGLLSLPPLHAQPPAPVKPRIDPAGINGALILSGKDVPAEAVEQFVALAGGKAKAKITVLYVASPKKPKLAFLTELRKELDVAPGDKLHEYGILKSDLLKNPEMQKNLDAATGVWLHGDNSADFSSLASNKVLREALAKVVKRGGVVAGSASGAPLLGETQTCAFSANGLYGGLGLLPDSLVGLTPTKANGNVSVAKLLNNGQQGVVGYEIGPKAALLVQGRYLHTLGNAKVTIHLAAGAGRAAKEIVLAGKKREADLTALRYSALARTQSPFPPKKLAPPVVKKGTLVIVGGGGMPKGLVKQFVEFAGGKKAVIVVLPTAQPDPLPAKDGIAEAFKKFGAKKVTYLKARKLKDVESKETLDAFREATGIWFGGGRQWGFVDAYAGTKVEPLMHEVLAKGGVIGGSSAGASIQGEYMPRGDPLGNLNIIAEGYEKGLGFLKGVAIDQHFTQRKRHADMTLLMKTYPQLLGIGLDEATALIVKGHIADVTGNGKAFFYDTKRAVAAGEPDYEAVATGGRYDLKSRQVLDKGKAHP